jgi:nucleotide-binding universal stress UspA family protein
LILLLLCCIIHLISSSPAAVPDRAGKAGKVFHCYSKTSPAELLLFSFLFSPQISIRFRDLTHGLLRLAGRSTAYTEFARKPLVPMLYLDCQAATMSECFIRDEDGLGLKVASVLNAIFNRWIIDRSCESYKPGAGRQVMPYWTKPVKILLPIDMMVPIDAVLAQVETLLPLSGRTVHILYINEECRSCENPSHTAKMYANDRWQALRHPAACVDECVRRTMDEAERLLSGRCHKVEREIVCGPPDLMIDTVLREENVDLTVLTPGSHLMRSLLYSAGSSHSRVKRGSTAIFFAPTLVKESFELRNILVHVSGSCSTEDLVLKTVELFELNRRSVDVVLLHVVDVFDTIKCISPADISSHIEKNLVRKGEKLIAEAKQHFLEAGVGKVDYALVHGKPSRELLAAAKAIPADVIIATAHERNGIKSLFQRRLLEQMIIDSPCTVTVIRELDGAWSKERFPFDSAASAVDRRGFIANYRSGWFQTRRHS